MTCASIENRLSEYVENLLAPAERAEVEGHLASCPECRTLATELSALDAALRAQVQAPALSSNFTSRLNRVIAAEARLVPVAQREERRRALQSEFETSLATLRKHPLSLSGLIQLLSWVSGSALVAGLTWRYAPELAALAKQPWWTVGVGGIGWAPMVTGGVCVAVGLLLAFRRRLTSLGWA